MPKKGLSGLDLPRYMSFVNRGGTLFPRSKTAIHTDPDVLNRDEEIRKAAQGDAAPAVVAKVACLVDGKGKVVRRYVPEVGKMDVLVCPEKEMRKYLSEVLEKIGPIVKGKEKVSFDEVYSGVFGKNPPSPSDILEKYKIPSTEIGEKYWVNIPGVKHS